MKIQKPVKKVKAHGPKIKGAESIKAEKLMYLKFSIECPCCENPITMEVKEELA